MRADVIREKYLKFFESKGHKIVSSDSLVPKDDPTLLFTGAGMNQFKEYFLGIKKDLKRAATSQKCLRTGDVDNVGKTPSHHTFFEMLGNFSFGDYFKKEAIQWAWEFMTTELKVPEKRMWVSVYKDDSEAYDIWLNVVKLSKEKIVKMGDKDNFWPQEAKAKGPNGPCGPCSEIYVDKVEVWNLVFTQFNRCEGGVLEPLPRKNIDTGMGLERIAAVMQGVHSNFETDLFVPIINAINDEAATMGGCHSERSERDTHPEMAATIADHIRAATFLIADGVLPSNEGRGYVERMLIRRAARFGKKLGIEDPFLYKLVPSVAAVMKKPYPELEARRENIALVLQNEEEKFSQTLEEGVQILEAFMKNAKHKEISGDVIFKLYDTYGFPYDLTEEMAKEKGFKLDKPGYQKAMSAQKETSRKSSAIAGEIFATTVAHKIKKLVNDTEFLGYDTLSCEAKVVLVLKKENVIESAGENDEIWVVLDKAPFYGESGGQTGDTGRIYNNNAEIAVLDTKMFDKIAVHVCKVKKGVLKSGDTVKAEVDSQRRSDIAKNHTATHLLQAALRKVLGEHVHQAGSLVAPDRLRFDFVHFKSLTPEQIERVEDLVNTSIEKNYRVSVKQMPQKEATASGAMALFGEKYEDEVRVVTIEDYSKELCGGTHLENTGQIGSFKIISETSISAGIRRIEAVTGKFVKGAIEKERVLQEQAAKKEAEDKIKAETDKARSKVLLEGVDEIIKKSKIINGIKIMASEVRGAGIDDLRGLCDRIKSKEQGAAILLASKSEDKVSLVLVLSKDLVAKGMNAANIIKEISGVVKGTGGGRPDMAQAGGKDPSKLKEVFKRFEELISSLAAKRDS